MKKLMGARIIPAVLNPNIRSYTPKNTGQKPVLLSNFSALRPYQWCVFFILNGSVILQEKNNAD